MVDEVPELQLQPKDFFPKPKQNTWPDALVQAISAGGRPEEQAFDKWAEPLDLAGSGIAKPSIAQTASSRTAPLPISSARDNCVLSVVSCDNVRALGASTQPIVLSPWLTVFYGRNGSGKSSVAQAIAVHGGAIAADAIPGKASDIPAEDRYDSLRRATVKVCALGEVRKHPTSFRGGTDLSWLSDTPLVNAIAVRVLDKPYLDEFGSQLRLDMSPELGLRVFDQAGAALSSFDLAVSMVKQTASTLLEKLFAEDELARAEEALEALDRVRTQSTDVLVRRRDALQRQANDLAQADAAARTTRNQVVELEAEATAVSLLSRSENSQLELRSAVTQLDTLHEEEKTGLRDLLDSGPLPLKDMEAWRAFVLAGDELLAKEQKPDYPGESDKCLYCGQELRASALTFLRTVRQEVSGLRRARIQELSSRLKAVRDALLILSSRLDVDREKWQSSGWPDHVPSGMRLQSAQDEIISDLTTKRQTMQDLATPESRAEARAKIAPLLKSAEIDCFAKERAASLSKMTQLRQVVKSAEEALTEVENQQRLWSTQKTRAAEALGLPAFRMQFENECRSLNFRVPLNLKATSPSGVTERKYTARGREPRKTLSESEIATWAFADTMAEMKHRGSSELLLLDDPVSSMDTERMELVVKRILVEADQRQVIVFTHNRHFFHRLLSTAKQHAVFKGMAGRGPLVYLIEAYKGTTGFVSPYDESEKPRVLLDRVAKLIATQPQNVDIVDLCFLLLRRAIEVIIDQVVLRGTRTLFDPEAVQLAWKDLKGIKAIPADLIDRLHDLHSGISRQGGLHATGEFYLLCPITDDVAYYHTEIVKILEAIETL